MDDRRKLRRYLALVHHAEDALELSLQAPAVPAPAEAVAALEDIVRQAEPAIERMNGGTVAPAEIERLLAGWVH